MSETYSNPESSTLHRLRSLEQSGLYLFHGSGERIDTLEPRQAVSQGKSDGEPAVCAAYDPDTAIYMALMDSARKVVLASGQSCRTGYSRNKDAYRFYATKNITDAVRSASGWVHVISRNGFTTYYEGTEMRRISPVDPLEAVQVQFEDFGFTIDVIEEEDFAPE